MVGCECGGTNVFFIQFNKLLFGDKISFNVFIIYKNDDPATLPEIVSSKQLLHLIFKIISDIKKVEIDRASLKTGIFQIMANNSAAVNCFLCGENASDIKKLKFHLLLKHSKCNLCLFCIEKKGWSSEFPRNAFKSYK